LIHILTIPASASTAALAQDGSAKKEEAEPMIHKIEAMVLFVQGHSPADDVLAPVLVEFFKS
jgi:hypothetical protein